MSKIEIRRAVEHIDEIFNEYGYKKLREIEFFCKDKWEINIVILLDIYVQIYSIQRAKEVYSELRRNKCCKRSKVVKEYLREVENDLRGN